MFIRKLTDEETVKIKKSKDAANKIIKEQRKKLVEEIKTYLVPTPRTNQLEKKLEKTLLVVGHPAIVNLEGLSVYVDYDILSKFCRSLDKSGFWSHTTKIEGASLIIRYTKHGQSGGVELFIPAYQAELFMVLPSIDLKE